MTRFSTWAFSHYQLSLFSLIAWNPPICWLAHRFHWQGLPNDVKHFEPYIVDKCILVPTSLDECIAWFVLASFVKLRPVQVHGLLSLSVECRVWNKTVDIKAHIVSDLECLHFVLVVLSHLVNLFPNLADEFIGYIVDVRSTLWGTNTIDEGNLSQCNVCQFEMSPCLLLQGLRIIAK